MFKRFLLFIICVFALTFAGCGESYAAPVSKDKLQKVEQHQPHQQAVLTDSYSLYRICNARPQRVIPCWASPTSSPSKLPSKNTLYHFILTTYRGHERQETAPFHFDVASKYYTICLRHLLCWHLPTNKNHKFIYILGKQNHTSNLTSPKRD